MPYPNLSQRSASQLQLSKASADPGLASSMPTLPHLPEEIVVDLVLRALHLGAPICDMSAVSSIWHSVVVRHLAELLILRNNGDMVSVLSRALKHNKLDVALDLVSKTGSLKESEKALVLVARSGQAGLVAAKEGHIEVVCMMMDAPQHAAHDGAGEALVQAAGKGRIEVVQLLLDAPHGAHADCQGGAALIKAATYGHSEIGEMDRYLWKLQKMDTVK
eukprot:gene30394-biopygen16263